MGEQITITGTEKFNGTYDVVEKTIKCHCCGSMVTERQAIQAGMLPNPDETVDQFFARTGQND